MTMLAPKVLLGNTTALSAWTAEVKATQIVFIKVIYEMIPK